MQHHPIFFSGSVYVPPNRLLNLLRQAVAYQIEVSRYHPRISPIVDTLLQDFSPFVIPNACKTIMQGHRGNVKCAEFVGHEGRTIISGSRYIHCMIFSSEEIRDIVFPLSYD